MTVLAHMSHFIWQIREGFVEDDGAVGKILKHAVRPCERLMHMLLTCAMRSLLRCHHARTHECMHTLSRAEGQASAVARLLESSQARLLPPVAAVQRPPGPLDATAAADTC